MKRELYTPLVQRHLRLSQLGRVSPSTCNYTSELLIDAVLDADRINGCSSSFVVIAVCGLSESSSKKLVDLADDYLSSKGAKE